MAEIQAVYNSRSGSPSAGNAEVLPPEEAAAAGLSNGEVRRTSKLLSEGPQRLGSDRKPGRKRIRWLAQLLKRRQDVLVDMHGTGEEGF